jgi:transcription antitermination protein NusB
MSARGKARKRALDILFEAEIRSVPVIALLDERTAAASPPVSAYAADLVQGVQQHRDQIDGLLAAHARGWTLERMPAVDRNILRIGTFELLWQDDVPDGVVISEAVQLARDLSTDGSPSFINGLLARLLELKPGLDLDGAGLELSEARAAGLDAGVPEADAAPRAGAAGDAGAVSETGPELEPAVAAEPRVELEADAEPQPGP